MGAKKARKTEDQQSIQDCVHVALACCDEFLLQDVFQRMSDCQIAIPILKADVKNEGESTFHVWATRSIEKSWRKNKSIQCKGLVASKKVNTISFIRLGDLKSSKSGLVNMFVTQEQGAKENNIFLTKEIDKPSTLSPGSIELCWFTPEGKKDEKLQDLTMVYNLRGDGKKFEKQKIIFVRGIRHCCVYCRGF